MSIQDEQAPIDIEIVNCAIECTPEEWDDFHLNLEYEYAEDLDSMGNIKHNIIASNSQSEFATPSDELFNATNKLNKLFYKYGVEWVNAKYHIYITEEEQWKYEADFQY